MTTNDPAIIKTWVQLQRAATLSQASIEAALKAADMPPLGWYDVLLELERAGKGGIRPFKLQQQLLLPQYGLSRLLARIENSGYLVRKNCDDDGRGQVLLITLRGRQIRKRMWSVYGPAIQQAIGKRLSRSDAKQLSGILERLISP